MTEKMAAPAAIETITVPATQVSPTPYPMATYDPILFLLQLPLFPLMAIMQMQVQMMKMMSFTPQPSGVRIITLRRDPQGNIIEIMERG
jgi:hypothetical protein